MMKNHFLFILLCLVFFSGSAFSAETQCDKESQVIFNCKIRNSTKIVSVCSQVMVENQDEKYLQYRYGALRKVELLFPNEHNIKRSQFSYNRFYSNNSGTLQYSLSFNIEGNKYKVYWYESSKLDGEPLDKVVINSGIYVSVNNGKTITLTCSDDVDQNLESSSAYNVVNVED